MKKKMSLKEVYQRMLAAGIRLEADIERGEESDYGICRNLSSLTLDFDYSERCHKILKGFFKTWNGYDPDLDQRYPVGGRIEYDRGRRTKTLYKNPIRIDLLKHALSELEKGPTLKMTILDWFNR